MSNSLLKLPAGKSLMLVAGRIGFLITAALIAVSSASILTGAAYAMVVVPVLLPVASIFGLMWMMGAIERRLIEINETLRAREP